MPNDTTPTTDDDAPTTDDAGGPASGESLPPSERPELRTTVDVPVPTEILEDVASERQQRPATEGREEDPAETPDEVVMQRHAEADRLDSVPITIELTSPMIELIDHARKTDEGESVTDWIKQTIQAQLARHDHEHWNSVTVDVVAELPAETAQWARLWANHHAATGPEPHDVENTLLNYVNHRYEWRVQGGGEAVDVDLVGDAEAVKTTPHERRLAATGALGGAHEVNPPSPRGARPVR